MQAMESNLGEADRKRVVAVLNTLAGVRQGAGTLGEVAHDARNVVAALSLYCDLVAEPGVLGEGHGHYAGELRLLSAASRRLVEKLTLMDATESFAGGEPRDLLGARLPVETMPERAASAAGRLPGDPIENLQQELLANRNLLDAIAGLGVSVSVRTEGGARPVRLASEDFTRILVNLVKNAAEAMRSAGAIEMTLRETPHSHGGGPAVVLLIDDAGPGIPAEALERIFEPGFTSHSEAESASAGGWPAAHRGLGLSITRSIVEQAGGSIEAANRPQGGAQFRLELPVRRPRGAR
jgi:signal transduction histidine kinase